MAEGSDVVDALRIRVLGGLVVEGISDTQLGSRKGRTVLKRLVLARGLPVPVSALADAVWGDALPSRPDEQLAVLVSRLRHAVGRQRLPRTSAGYAVLADWLDLDELAVLVEQADAALASGRIGAARAAADAALNLERGPVLPDDDDAEWADVERARATALVTRAARVAAEAALAAGDLTAAIVAAEAQLARDPYDEASLRVLMRAHAGEGRAATGLAAYARTRRRLADDLGVSPSPETAQLHSALLLGDVATPESEAADGERFVGRVDELAWLQRQHAAAVGAVRVAQVEGEAGIGKSALMRRFAEIVASGGGRVVRAATDELGRDLPLQPLLEVLGLSPPEHTGDPDRARVAWYRQVLDAIVGPDRSGPPAVLVLDDAHRADPATREFVAWLRGRPVPLLVVAVTRLGDRLEGALRLTVGPMAAADLAELIAPLAGAGQVPAIHARSAGNPLFALAIAAAPEGTTPTDVHEAVGRTLDALGGDVAPTVQAAAVLGIDVDVDLLSAVLRQSAAEVLGHLEAALDSGILVERGAGFAFRHEIVREVLAASASTARVAWLHRQAASTLGQRGRGEPLALAVHARLGGDLEVAGQAFVEAANASTARGDLESAAQHLRSALDCGEDTARTELAKVLMAARRLDDAAMVAEEAVAVVGDAASLEVAGWVAYYARDYDRAERFADAAVDRAGAASPDVRVRAGAMALGGRTRHARGDLVGAESRLREALAGDRRDRLVAQTWLAQVQLHVGRPAEALELAERSLVDPGHHTHPFSPLHGASYRATALGYLGRVADALAGAARLDSAIERAGEIGARFAAVPDNIRAWLLRNSGRRGEADEMAHRALAVAGGEGSRSATALVEARWVAELELTEGRLAFGDLAGAEDHLAVLVAMDEWHGSMSWHQRHRRDVVRARWARRTGDADVAAELAARVAADASTRGAGRYAALARAELALADGGDPASLDSVIDDLERTSGLEAWWITLELANRFAVPAWTTRAQRSADRLRSGVAPDQREAFDAALRAAFDDS